MTNGLNIETKAKAPRRRKIVSLDRRKARMGWLFVLPFLIGFVLVYLPILIDSFKIAFAGSVTKGEYGDVYGSFGFKNFKYALVVDPNFVRILISGIGRLALEVPAILLFSLFMAVLLNQKMMGRAAFRAIFFLPVVLATGVMELTGSLDAGTGGGDGTVSGGDAADGSAAGSAAGSGGGSSGIVSTMDIENLFSNMKVGQELVGYVVDLINNIYGIVSRSGVQMLIFLSGLQSISPAIYEACKIDGATGWETFWKITFPMISPMILVNAVYTIIDSFTVQNAVMDYINGFSSVNDPSLTPTSVSTAMALIYFLIIVLILAAVAGIISMFVFYQRKD